MRASRQSQIRNPSLAEQVSAPVKRFVADRIIAVFNDKAANESPVKRRPDGLFGPKSVTWRVHGDVASMMVGGVAGLLLQMLHPAVLAGVWDHSKFRSDMHGRLRRTARFIAVTTYGAPAEAQAAIAHVKDIHSHVTGILQDGTPYAANDPLALAWVHATGSVSFLNAWIRYGEPGMLTADKDRYFAEMAQVAQGLGASPIPKTLVDAQRFIKEMRPHLRCDARTRNVCHLVLAPPVESVFALPLQSVTMQAAVDLLPAWAQQMHGLEIPILARPLIRTGALGMAETLRWAFR